MYEVVSPLGESAVSATPMAPRLSDLNGKTVGEVWNGEFDGQVTFPLIRELLRRRYPGIKIIPYTEFPITRVETSTQGIFQALKDTAALAVQKHCDAVITGNGF